MSDSNFWDNRYSEDDFAYGRAPNEFLVEQIDCILASNASLLPSTTVLVVADGEGRNSIFLAKRGLSVTAVDFSPVGMAKLRKWASAEGLQSRITTNVCDLGEYDFGICKWDIIVSIFAHLPAGVRYRVHAAIALSLKPGGVIILEAYHPNNIGRKTGGPHSPDMCMTSAALSIELQSIDDVICNEEKERVVNEGKYHSGLAAVTHFVARKKLDVISIMWPSTKYSDFETAAKHAISYGCPLLIAENFCFSINVSLVHKLNSSNLVIIGLGAGSSRPIVTGYGHSIFQIGGRGSSLHLENLQLHHNCDREDHREVGAAVFGLYLSKVSLRKCDIISSHGFGVWAAQKARISMDGCSVRSVMRSGCVVFGKAKLYMERCVVRDCKIHNICSRGNTEIHLKFCELLDAETRAFYGYHSASVVLEDCIIKGTRSSAAAAVDIYSSSIRVRQTPNDRALRKDERGYLDGQGARQAKHVKRSLHCSIVRCTISDNTGIGLRFRRQSADDELDHHIEECVIVNNCLGDVVIESTETRIQTTPSTLVRWQFERDEESVNSTERWKDMNPEMNLYIERHYESYISASVCMGSPGNDNSSCSAAGNLLRLPIPMDSYVIDFDSMQQTNTATHLMRILRRISPESG